MPVIAPHLISDLVDAAASVGGHVELSAMLRSTVRTAMDLTGARYGALGVLGDHGTLVDFIHLGLDEETAREIGHLPRGRGVLGTITRTGETIRVDHIAQHEDSVGFPDAHPPMDSFLGVPVRVGDRVFGNLYLADKPGGFTPDDELIAEFLAVTAGTAVSTMRLQERLRRTALLEDRERIARDLHDSIIQDLFAVGLGLQASTLKLADDPAGVEDQLQNAIEKLDGTISSLRRYIFDLRPPVWARPSFANAVSALLDELAAPHGVDVSLDFDCPPEIPEGALAEQLHVLIKESVSNALRHGSPSTLDVRVFCEGGMIRASISDDGSGFDPDGDHEGFGLVNMRDRVADLEGSIFIDSVPDAGTVVHLALPLRPVDG